MNNSIPLVPGRKRPRRQLLPLLLLATLGLGGLGIALAASCEATCQGQPALLIQVSRYKSGDDPTAAGELLYRLGDLRSSNLAAIGQELELSRKFLRGPGTPAVVIQAGPEISCRELGQVLDEILRRGLGRVEIERLDL